MHNVNPKQTTTLGLAYCESVSCECGTVWG